MHNNVLGKRIWFGDFVLCPESGELYRRNTLLKSARPQEIALLALLVERAGKRVGKREIIAQLWPNEIPPKNRLNVLMSTVRSRLGDTKRGRRKYIATLGTEGYCFICPITRVESLSASFESIEAEQAFRSGMQCLENREDTSMRNAVAHFKRAINKNPLHARAWAGLADAYLILGFNSVDAPKDTFPKALAAAKEAARIDAHEPLPHVVIAMVELCYFRLSAGPEEKFKEALRVIPSLYQAHNGLGLLQAATGRAEASVSSLQRAITSSPLTVPLNAFLCYMLCFARKFEDAITAGQKAVLADPDSFLAHLCLGNAMVLNTRYKDALIHLEKARLLSHDSKCSLGYWGYGYAVAGFRDRAEEALSRLTSVPPHEYVPSYFVGLIHLGLSHVDSAIDWFDRACDERSNWVIFLNSDPTFDGVRTHPRFKRLIRKSTLR